MPSIWLFPPYNSPYPTGHGSSVRILLSMSFPTVRSEAGEITTGWAQGPGGPTTKWTRADTALIIWSPEVPTLSIGPGHSDVLSLIKSVSIQSQ